MRRRLIALGAAIVAALALSSCSLLSPLFTSEELDDAVINGFKSGPIREVAEGVVLSMAVRGEPALREVLCVGERAAVCREIPENAEVRVAGDPNANGTIVPSRISWDRRP